MLYIKEGTKEKIKGWHAQDIHILADFDRTITEGNSNSSWSILSKSNLVPKEYVEERQKLYDYYRPIEIDENISYEEKNRLMSEWWNKHINLFIKYQLSEDVINNACNDLRVMAFRKGSKEFLEKMHIKNIPVIIISAGIGNFIKQFLINNNCYYDNIYIVSNFIKFENGIATGIIGNVTHSFNKNEVFLDNNLQKLLEDRPHTILLGDQISDILMAKEERRDDALKIGFLDECVDENLKFYKEAFDIVGINNVSYHEIFENLKSLDIY